MTLRDIVRRRRRFHEAQDEGLPEVSASHPDVTPISSLVARVDSTIVGEVVSVRVVPKVGRTPWLEATVSDGGARMVLMWTGRTSIPGVRPGRRVRASGRPSATGPGGRLVLMNPLYELL